MKTRIDKNTRARLVKRIAVVCCLLGMIYMMATWLPNGPSVNRTAAAPVGTGAQGLLPAAPGMQAGNISSANRPGGTQAPAISALKVGHSVKNDTSPALRDMKVLAPGKRQEEEENENPPLLSPGLGSGGKVKDPVVQSSFHSDSPAMPNPILNFDGISYATGGTGFPPDTNGAAGFVNYIQIVNGSFSIWNKSGTPLYGPAATNTLWQGFGGPCETNNSGDPIVLYDRIANRWLLSQFALGPAPNHVPSWECIAISASDDAMGGWYRYAFHMSDTVLYDYPKFGSWTFGYFMSANLFGSPYYGGAAVAFDRSSMIMGYPATYQEFDTAYGGMLPSDEDGFTLPPFGTPNFFLALLDSSDLGLWKFHVDFQNPANSTFIGPSYIPVASYNENLCADANGACIPQPETAQRLSGLNDRLMNRLAYRNFGDHESLVVDHTVDSDTGAAGIRWYEIRDPNGTPTVYQQSTYALADNNYRWLGSIAQDHDGNIAMGMSVSGFYPVYPSIAYTGRLASDPPGQMTQGENVLLNGGGSQTNTYRWGDYSAITTDPSDDCTFWYTTEYYQTTGNNWHTRIGTFKFPSCGNLPTATRTATRTATPTVTYTPTITPTPPPCGPLANYVIATATATIVPGTADSGNHCDDCVTTISVPFAYSLYNQSFTTAYVSSNGQLDFGTGDSNYQNTCLPDVHANYAIFPHWGDLLTDTPGYGIFTSVSGSAPNRIFNIEWRAQNYSDNGDVNFEVRLYEGQQKFDIIYGEVDQAGGAATVGVQKDTGSQVTQFSCDTAVLTPGLELTFTQPACIVPTFTATPTATATVPPCGTLANYTIATATATIVPGTVDTGNHCDDCVTAISLPFAYSLYDQSFTTAYVSSNGQLDFGTADGSFGNFCLPNANASYAIFPYWGDLTTENAGYGIYTTALGSAPNRTFNIEWRDQYYPGDGTANFEVRLYEGQQRFDIVYGQVDQQGSAATVGVQRGTGSRVTQFSCNTAALSPGLQLTFTQATCSTSTPTNTPTLVPSSTPSATATATATASGTPAPLGLIVGHTTWQGITQPSSHNVGLTDTLRVCVNGVIQNYPASTDASGNITFTTELADGSYYYQIEGAHNLANLGSLTVTAGRAALEFGMQRAGDANGNNVVNAQDFTILKGQFGQGGTTADFNNDGVVNATDFTLLKGNFGQAGGPAGCP